MKKPNPLLTLLALVATTCALGAGESLSKFDAALQSAEANEATPAGGEFDTAVGMQFGEEHANTVAGCAEGAHGKDLAKFNLVMKLDGAGNVVEALVYPETTVAKCLQAAVAHDAYPKPVHPGYWVRVEMSLKP